MRALKDNDDQINDHLQNIDIFHTRIEDINTSLSERREKKLTQAQAQEPKKPRLFGKRRWEKKHKDWEKTYKDYIDAYKSLEDEREESQKKLDSHGKSLEEAKKERDNKMAELKKLCRQMKDELEDCGAEKKMGMDKYRADLIGLLSLGVEVSEGLAAVDKVMEASAGIAAPSPAVDAKSVDDWLKVWLNERLKVFELKVYSIFYSIWRTERTS